MFFEIFRKTLDKKLHLCYTGSVDRGRHPSEKTAFTAEIPKPNNKGVTPIEKNILVVDELGNEYEATYPKRAKGLVKNGRARFVAENKICLACPPDIMKTEDIDMSENTKTTQTTETTETIEETEIPANVETPQATASLYTEEYILQKIAEMQAATAHLHECMDKLADVRSDGPEDIGAQAKAQALADIVRCRETTNQQMLAIYEKMLERLMEKDETAKQITKMSALTEWAKTLKCEEYNDQVWEVINNALYEKLQDA